MIGKLTGSVLHLEDDHVILDVNKVGYIIYLTTSTLSSCKVGDNIAFFIDMVVKENQLTLYGFVSQEEKKCFKLLQTVQGVGAKMAIAILSAISVEAIANAILAGDVQLFKSVSGVGPKLAERITNELKNKKWPMMPPSVTLGKGGAISPIHDALSALSNLGFNRTEAFKVLQELQANDDSLSLEELIKQGLARLA